MKKIGFTAVQHSVVVVTVYCRIMFMNTIHTCCQKMTSINHAFIAKCTLLNLRGLMYDKPKSPMEIHPYTCTKIMTWNATGIMSSCSYLCDVWQNESIDICGISEHWLYNHNLHFLDCIHSSNRSYAKADGDLGLPGNRRVGKGGVAFFWNVRLDAPGNSSPDR